MRVRTAGEALTLTLPSIRATWALYNTAGQRLLAITLALCVGVTSAVAIVFQPDETDDQTETTAVSAVTRSSITHESALSNAASSSEAPEDFSAAIDGGPISSVRCTHRELTLPSGDEQTAHHAAASSGQSQQEQHRCTSDENGGTEEPKMHELHQHGDPTPAPTRRRPAEFKDQSQTGNAGVIAATTPIPTPTKRSRSYRRGGEVLYIAEGVAEAVVGILRDPVKGAQGDGARGLVKGIGSGVVGIVVRPVRGMARAGQNAYNGVRIGVSRARVGTKGGSSSSSKHSSKENAGLHENSSPAQTKCGKTPDTNGSTPADPAVVSPVAARNVPRVVASTTAPNGSSGTGTGTKVAVVSPRRRPSPFDGLVLGVSTVPLVLSTLYLLMLANQSSRAAFSVCDGGVEPVSASDCDGEDCGGGGEALLSEDSGLSMAVSGCVDVAIGDGYGGHLVILRYLQVLLEGSILCATSEAVLAIQRVLKGQTLPAVCSRMLLSGPLRLTVLAALCWWHCRMPLLPLWCLAVYDLLRRALDGGDSRVARALSLRPGEAAVLAHAVALWSVDAVLYTFQELWVPDSAAWRGLFPHVPFRSGGMVIVQTGLLGTLATGATLAVARAWMPTSWSSDFLGHLVTYAVVVTGTAGWLERWTAPLLGSNPVIWACLYALGLSVPDRPPSYLLYAAAVPSGVGAGGGNNNNAAELLLVRNPTVASEVSFSAGIFVLFEQLVFGRALYSGTEVGEGVSSGCGVFFPGISVLRPLLVAGWVLALVVVIPAVPVLVKWFKLSKIASRKVYHALVTIMFIPAIAIEPEFLSLALGAAMGVLLTLEYLRCAGCPPLAKPLDRYFGTFLDARDGGCFVMTHLFLLLGCAIPVWVSRLLDHAYVLPYTGVVIVGIGDAMGAVVGSNLGQNRWPGSRRTLEGSAAVFLSSFFAFAALMGFVTATTVSTGDGQSGTAASGWGWWKACASMAWPVAVATLTEALTTQVDNIVLPCVLLSSLPLQRNH